MVAPDGASSPLRRGSSPDRLCEGVQPSRSPAYWVQKLSVSPFLFAVIQSNLRPMIRLTLLLAFCLWLVFVLGPEPQPHVEETATDIAAPVRDRSGEITELTLETGEVWEVDRIIATRAVADPPVDAPVVAASAAIEETASDGTPEADTPAVETSDAVIFYVTGTRVNLRAGPSTNDAIVAALTQGTATEYVADAPDGWLQIRDPATGNVGFMSGDFLSQDQP